MDGNEQIENIHKEQAEKNKQLEKDFAEHFIAEITRRNLIFDRAHQMDKKVIICDIDGTICSQRVFSKERASDDEVSFREAVPFSKRIEYMNSLYDDDHYIIYWTARGYESGTDFLEETKNQLNSWNVKYNECITFKPNYDIWIDDKAIGVARDTEGSISDFKPRIEEALSKVQFPSSKE